MIRVNPQDDSSATLSHNLKSIEFYLTCRSDYSSEIRMKSVALSDTTQIDVVHHMMKSNEITKGQKLHCHLIKWPALCHYIYATLQIE